MMMVDAFLAQSLVSLGVSSCSHGVSNPPGELYASVAHGSTWCVRSHCCLEILHKPHFAPPSTSTHPTHHVHEHVLVHDPTLP